MTSLYLLFFSACQGNQEWQLEVSDIMPTCANKNPQGGDGGPLFGGCRCPVDLPYLMDDGITCTADCPTGEHNNE